jgi:hypothetical protein
MAIQASTIEDLQHIYMLVERLQFDDAISYWFSCTALMAPDEVFQHADVDRLDESVIVAILLGTRTRKATLLSRADFASRAKEKLAASLSEDRFAKLWERVE